MKKLPVDLVDPLGVMKKGFQVSNAAGQKVRELITQKKKLQDTPLKMGTLGFPSFNKQLVTKKIAPTFKPGKISTPKLRK